MKGTPTNTAAAGIPMPRIGEQLQDGVFAGIARGVDGGPDVALVDLGFAAAKMSHEAAAKHAEERAAALPTRAEARILWANVDRLASDKQGYFWTNERYAGGESSAWYQSVDDGGQSNGHRDYELRVRLVRRLPLSN